MFVFFNCDSGEILRINCEKNISKNQSVKAMAITFCHGSITDRGMMAFLKGLDATQAPIKALHFIDLPDVSDKSLSVLPEIIEKKGITLCEIWSCGVSQDLAKRINLACNKNQNITMSKNNSLINT